MGGVKTIATVSLVLLAVAMGVTVYAATCGATAAPAATNVVRAERFELVDAEGNIRAVLGLHEQPRHVAQRITIVDREGNTVVIPEGAVVADGGKTEVPSLVLMDSTGRNRIEVTFDWEGQPVIRLMDEEGKVTCAMPPAPGFKMLGG